MRLERRAVCLDRDGTVVYDADYPRDPNQVRLMPGAAAALFALRRHGFLLVFISNQSGIGRGLVRLEEAEQVHRQVLADLAEQGVQLDGAYYCPHAPEEGCACRKPSPWMLTRAAHELGFDLAKSFMVGDKSSDIEAGRRAGCRTILLRSVTGDEGCSPVPDVVAANWPETLAWILNKAGVTA
jgi:D-glycero-D-manno-heptose 1,7-bisphosphate phosphatase